MTHNYVGLILFFILLIFAFKYILSPITLTSFITYIMDWGTTIFHLTGLTLYTLYLELFIVHRAARVILSKLNSDHIIHVHKTVRGDEYVYGIDCSDSFMGVYFPPNSSCCMH